jgi:hypothetical protein
MTAKNIDSRPKVADLLADPLFAEVVPLNGSEQIVLSLPCYLSERYEKEYREIRPVTKMGYGNMQLVETVKDQKLFIAQKNLRAEIDKDAFFEIQLRRKLAHPNIQQTKEFFFDSKNDLTMIVEVCGFGSLLA